MPAKAFILKKNEHRPNFWTMLTYFVIGWLRGWIEAAGNKRDP